MNSDTSIHVTTIDNEDSLNNMELFESAEEYPELMFNADLQNDVDDLLDDSFFDTDSEIVPFTKANPVLQLQNPDEIKITSSNSQNSFISKLLQKL